MPREHPALRGILTLSMACMACTADASHVTWDVDTQRTAARVREESRRAASCVKFSRVRRHQ